MKSIVVLSGKGGVGKSSIAASLAVAFAKDRKIVCADCDVDASNLSLLFGLTTDRYLEWMPLSTNQTVIVDKPRCIGCGKCLESCYFDALEMKDGKAFLKGYGCEGCGVCELVCPTKAITLSDIDNAFIGHAKTAEGFSIASAQLSPGNSGSGKVVAAVRKKAKDIAPQAELSIIDAAAGIGCPVIASVTGNDYAVLVTEPTPSGYADMLRALEIVDHFGIKKGMIINKYDLNEVYTKKIEDFAKRKCINILVKIPFDRAFIKAMIEMIPVIKSAKEYDDIFTQIKNSIVAEIDM